MQSQPNCVAILSGGLDSTTLVYDLLNEGDTPLCLSFDYGQKHNKELQYAQETTSKLGLEHHIVDLRALRGLLSSSSLTSDQAVPEGHYAEENMKQTVVPNRNMIMLSIAVGVAVNRNLEFVATGVHAGDHFVYPDCRPRFIYAVSQTAALANAGFGTLPEIEEGQVPRDDFIRAPYLFDSKAAIAFRAMKLEVPLHETWSCYKGGEMHCGKCGTCVERLEAIAEARGWWMGELHEAEVLEPNQEIPADETKYEDPDFWRTVTR